MPSSNPPGFTFPASILRPTPSQLDLAADEVTNTIAELEAWFVEHGARLGVPFHDFALREPIALKPATAPTTNAQLLALLLETFTPQDCVSFEKRDSRWGLWFQHVAPGSMPKPKVPLRDAPLAIRKTFLFRSDAFAAAFLKAAEAALQEPHGASRAGQATLAKLRAIQPR
jgi:hypothetical protein